MSRRRTSFQPADLDGPGDGGLALGGRDLLDRGDEAEILGDGHFRVEGDDLGQVADDPLDLVRLLEDVKARDEASAVRGRQIAGQDPHGGGLAGGVRTEQAPDPAFFDLEAEVVDGRRSPYFLVRCSTSIIA